MRIPMKTLSSLPFVFLVFLNGAIYSQGPALSFFYDANTNLPYASCQLCFENGATFKIPFLPVVNVKGALCGIDRYTRDIQITAPLTFLGNGIYKQGLYDCYKGVSVKGRMALFCYDFPDSISQQMKEKITTKSRIDEAISRGASGIVLFSNTDPAPSLPYWEMDENKVPEIPVISINRESAKAIFSASGIEPDKFFKKWEEEREVASKELDVNMNIKIVGQFGHVESEHFIYAYQKPGIDDTSMLEIIGLNERSVHFLLDLFSSEKVLWQKSFTCYFRDYDSKTRDAYIAEGNRIRNESTFDSWSNVFMKSLFDLEIEWVNWLGSNSELGEK